MKHILTALVGLLLTAQVLLGQGIYQNSYTTNRDPAIATKVLNTVASANQYVTHTDGYPYTNQSGGVYLGSFGGGPTPLYFADALHSGQWDYITGGNNAVSVSTNLSLPIGSNLGVHDFRCNIGFNLK